MPMNRNNISSHAAAPGDAPGDLTPGNRPPSPEITLNGVELIPDMTGALYWAGREVLLVADLHFEKGSSFARRGVHLPPYDTSSTLTLLESLMERFQPRSVICLGDSFHDGEASERLGAEERMRLRKLTDNLEWFWLTGNHDPGPPAGLGGVVAEQLEIAPLAFCHEPGATGRAGEISGHLHPAARVTSRGRSLRRKCFIGDDTKLIMPALGAYAGGLNVLSTPFLKLFPDSRFKTWIAGANAVYPVSPHRLKAD